MPFIDHLGWYTQLKIKEAIKSDTTQEKANLNFGAGWLNLVQPLPMHCRHWPKVFCQTHNLPSDVQAAPARATVKAVVELAVLNGCGTLHLSSQGYPLAVGRSAQLTFKEHPSLGLAAIFDRFAFQEQA